MRRSEKVTSAVLAVLVALAPTGGNILRDYELGFPERLVESLRINEDQECRRFSYRVSMGLSPGGVRSENYRRQVYLKCISSGMFKAFHD